MGIYRPAAVAAWSWVNCLGQANWREDSAEIDTTSGAASNGVRLSLQQALAVARFEDHEPYLGIPGWSGRAADPPPLPLALESHDSRAARLLHQALMPLCETVVEAVKRFSPERVAVVLGSSTGGIDRTELALARLRQEGALPETYDFFDVHPFHMLTATVQAVTGARGPSFVVSTACSSTGKALASAQRLLQAGACDAVLVGGADALCELTVRGFAGLDVLSKEMCRPFDAERSGINIGEGGALFLLDRDEKRRFWILGSGESSDAHHPTAPHPEGLGARLAIEACLEFSAIDKRRVSYVNAHGTATKMNDAMEARALAASLPGVPFSSTKHRTGHLLGAAGAMEAAFCLQALAEELAPVGHVPASDDPELPVHPMRHSVPLDGNSVVLSTSFAFGGNNVAVALGPRLVRGTNEPAAVPNGAVGCTFWVRDVALWAPGVPPGAVSSPSTPVPFDADAKPPAELLPGRARGRASMLTRIFAELFDQLTSSGEDRKTVASVYSSAYGEITTTMALLEQLGTDLKLSPLRFQSSVHNTASGQISLVTENRGFTTSLAAGQSSFAMALLEAQAWLAVHGGDILVLVADEELPRRLTKRESFCALGVGLRLCAEQPEDGLGRIEMVERAGDAGSRPTESAPSAPTTSPAILDNMHAGVSENPAAWGLDLVAALRARRACVVPIGPTSRVRVLA